LIHTKQNRNKKTLIKKPSHRYRTRFNLKFLKTQQEKREARQKAIDDEEQAIEDEEHEAADKAMEERNKLLG
jgi:hypothetical protein